MVVFLLYLGSTAGTRKYPCGFHFYCESVRNEPFIGLTPEPKLSVAVSVRAEAAGLLKHGKV